MRLKASYELAEVLELIKDARQLGMEIGTREGYKDGLDKGNEDGYGNGYRECLMAYYEILEGTHEFDRDCKIFGLGGKVMTKEEYERGFNDGESRMWYIRYSEISGIVKHIKGVIGEEQIRELLAGLYDDEEISIFLNWEEGEE